MFAEHVRNQEVRENCSTSDALWKIHFFTTSFSILDLVWSQHWSGRGRSLENRDQPYIWKTGAYAMHDMAGLKSRLIKARTVFGDIKNTGSSFFSDYQPAPIGAMLVDVNLYSSTVSLLNMFQAGDDYFPPRIFMYFDDIMWNTPFAGESLAIREFNDANQAMKISPDDCYFTWLTDLARGSSICNIKTCHRFHHPQYNKPSGLY